MNDGKIGQSFMKEKRGISGLKYNARICTYIDSMEIPLISFGIT
jgi:hypothetical protein